MGYGILNYAKLPHVPGTVILDDTDHVADASVARLKHGSGRNAHIVLAPQPSNDPNDPLNWSLWRRDGIFFVVTLGAIINTASTQPLLSSSTFVLAEVFGVSFSKIAQLTGYQLLMIGSVGIVVSGLARKFGNRPQFLIAAVMAVVGTIVCACAQDYHSLLGGRMVQGLGACAFESIYFGIASDLYFVHERGLRLAIVNIILSAMSNFCAIISGPITTTYGWRYMFYIILPFNVLVLILVFFFLPETSYSRDDIFNTDTAIREDLALVAEAEKKPTAQHVEGAKAEEAGAALDPVPLKKTYVQTLKVYSGKTSSEPLWNLLLAPIAVLMNPSIFAMMVITAVITCWYVAISFILAVVWAYPPYAYTPAQVGYLSAGPVIGGIIGGLVMIVVNDPTATFLARRNRGVYEPEFRLVHVITAAVGCAIGFFGFGNLIAAGKGPIVGAVFHGIILFGINVGNTAIGSYIVDAYRDLTLEIFICSMAVKNLLFFGCSYFFNNWYAKKGIAAQFNVCGAITLALLAMCLPMYVFGKIVRGQWSQNKLAQKFIYHRE